MIWRTKVNHNHIHVHVTSSVSCAQVQHQSAWILKTFYALAGCKIYTCCWFKFKIKANSVLSFLNSERDYLHVGLRSWITSWNFETPTSHLHLSLDTVRASEPCEPCMRVIQASHASLASHGSESCEPSENLSTRTMKPYRFQNAQSVSNRFLNPFSWLRGMPLLKNFKHW